MGRAEPAIAIPYLCQASLAWRSAWLEIQQRFGQGLMAVGGRPRKRLTPEEASGPPRSRHVDTDVLALLVLRQL